ncbi:interleukin-23 subunit alpha-like [Cyprinodon tularosa]|uniref:interleukin-23 subunit alpha-like n=1 Tax=Cyprinodon tularosa TaxID=77115 RepID=UPI0018E29148|nr:interleukin-23 subunit alpha-like [Cyprinodon tularosa]
MMTLSFVAFFCFTIPASGAPAGLKDDCENVKYSARDLNQHAKTAYLKARNESKDVAHFSNSLAWIDANDKCDPGSLKENSTPCIEKLLSVLTSYHYAVERISAFKGCSKVNTTLKPAIKKLHKDMAKCLRSLRGKEHHVKREEPQPVDQWWLEDLMCSYTLERLFSFSILTARVFAVGDPAHHSVGLAQKCPSNS